MLTLKKNSFIFSILAAFLALLMTACQNEKENPNPDAMIWDCSEISDDAKIDLNAIFGPSRVLGLEETDESAIGRINKLIQFDSLLIVLDKDLAKCIYLFDAATGKFIRKFGKTGAGPDEYISLNDVTLKEKSGQLYLLCDKYKILTYDLTGKLQDVRTLPFRASDIEYNKGHFYFANENAMEGEVIVADDSLDNYKPYLKNENNDFHVKLIHHFGKNDDGSITYIRFLDNKVYRIYGTDTIKVQYHIDWGKHGVTRESTIDMIKADENLNETLKEVMTTKIGDIRHFVENNDFAALYFFGKNKPYLSIYNKQNHSIQTAPMENVVDSITTTWHPIYFTNGESLIEIINDADSTTAAKRTNPEIYCGENPLIYEL